MLAGERLHAGPVAVAGFHLKSEIRQHLAVGIMLQGLAVVGGGGGDVVLAACQPAGQIAAEQRAALADLVGAVSRRCRDRRRADHGTDEQSWYDPEECIGPSAHVTSRGSLACIPYRSRLAEKATARDPNNVAIVFTLRAQFPGAPCCAPAQLRRRRGHPPTAIVSRDGDRLQPGRHASPHQIARGESAPSPRGTIIERRVSGPGLLGIPSGPSPRSCGPCSESHGFVRRSAPARSARRRSTGPEHKPRPRRRADRSPP